MATPRIPNKKDRMAGEPEFEIIRKARENMEMIKNDRQLIRIEIASIQDQFERLCEAYMRACDLDAECINELNSPPFDRNGVSFVDTSTSPCSSLHASPHKITSPDVRDYASPRKNTSRYTRDGASPRKNTFHNVRDHALPRKNTSRYTNDGASLRKNTFHNVRDHASPRKNTIYYALPRKHSSHGASDHLVNVGESDIFDWSDFSHDCGGDEQSIHEFNSDDEHPQITSPNNDDKLGLQLEIYDWDQHIPWSENESVNDKVNDQQQQEGTNINIKINKTPEKDRNKDPVNEYLYRMLKKTFKNETNTATGNFDYPKYHFNTVEAGESLAERFSMQDMEREIDNFYVMRSQIPPDQETDRNSDDGSETLGTETNLSSPSELDENDGDILTKVTNIDLKSCSLSHRMNGNPTNSITFNQSMLFGNKAITRPILSTKA